MRASRQLRRSANSSVLRSACCGLLAAGLSATASADDASTADAEQVRSTAVLEEIVVTAARREQRLMEIPQAITALPGSVLEDMGADAFADYARHVPGLDFTEYSPGQTRITVRGVSDEEGIATVSYYINDIAITAADQNAQPDFRLFDVERVEVLRGPQGTLYGEGSMGGTIRVITRKPVLDRFEGEVAVSGALIEDGGEDYSVNGMINVPIIGDRLALRIVGMDRQLGGWIDNVYPGSEQQDTNSGHSRTGRVELEGQLTDAFTINATAIINRLETDNNNVTNQGHDVSLAALNPRTDDYDLYGLTLRYEFASFALTSATAWTTRTTAIRYTDSQGALDFFNGFFIPITGGTYTIDKSLVYIASDGDNFTQELRLESTGDARLRWTAGLFYRDGEGADDVYRETTPELTFGEGNVFGAEPGTAVPGGIYTSTGSVETRNFAVFGEATYALTPALDLTGGLRWFKEEQDYFGQVSGAFVYDPLTNSFVQPPGSDSNEADDITPKFSISYHPTKQSLYYLTVARGFRSGGANQLAGVLPGASDKYKPDTTVNYEAGTKLTLNEGRLAVLLSAFYVDWKDMQVFDFDAHLGLGYISNAGAAHTQGLEFETVVRPLEGLTMSVNANWTEAELDSEIPGANYAVDGSTIKPGTRLPNVPQYKVGALAQYEFPLTESLSGMLAADISFVGDSYSRLEHGVNEDIGYGDSHQDAYSLGNLRAGVSAKSWSAHLFVNNVSNTFANLGDDNFGGFHRNQPRTYGAEMQFRF